MAFELGFHHEFTSKNEELAIKYYKVAFYSGDYMAAHRLARIYENRLERTYVKRIYEIRNDDNIKLMEHFYLRFYYGLSNDSFLTEKEMLPDKKDVILAFIAHNSISALRQILTTQTVQELYDFAIHELYHYGFTIKIDIVNMIKTLCPYRYEYLEYVNDVADFIPKMGIESEIKEAKRRYTEVLPGNSISIKEDLIRNRFHPRNLDKMVLWGHNEPDDFD